MELLDEAYSVVNSLLERVKEEEKENIENAAKILAKSLEKGGILHVIGAGHSAIIGEELSYRAGGLVPVNPIMDTDINVYHGAFKSTEMEHVEGYAEIVLKAMGVQKDDTVLVVSTSGVNVFPVETAIKAKSIGCPVIAITSVEYSRSLAPRNKYNKRLFEVADVVIDNKVPRGDAILQIPGFKMKIFPVSTITGAFIAQSIVALAIKELVEKGIEPPVFLSAHLPGAKEHNSKVIERYRARLKYL
ncbi:SIS domain-containing protein [Thermococcus aggregans]|uniref:SIS domain-containing protein n=1 Tax=Thermococcus aggregans TaxID=110163 RepID=A0A9E7MWF5_THEAG|nr:SIS domain-containing protein [Thermococcus aggregans]USS40140.1 SIS domain-containing protein [Thermococcus aggregans]